MTIVDDIVALLEADTNGSTGVADLLTGGIYTYEETGRLGISLAGTKAAYDTTTGVMKPCCVVKARGQNHDNGVWDDAAQAVSYRQVIEIWLYDDGSAGYATITSARARVFVVLHGNNVGSSGLIPRWAGNPVEDARDRELDYAAMLRTDYHVRGLV